MLKKDNKNFYYRSRDELKKVYSREKYNISKYREVDIFNRYFIIYTRFRLIKIIY